MARTASVARMSRPILYDYYRSSASYRVRIALNLKGLGYDRVPLNLLEGGQKGPDYRARNPQGFVPTLDIDGRTLVQSLAIIAYLDSTRPEPPLLPADAADAAHVRSLALAVACDIHPLNNLRVLKYLSGPLGVEQEARDTWYRHWVAEGLAALEAMAAPRAGRFLFGDAPTLADACLVPQMFNARRFEVPLDDYPTLVRADGEANRLEPFAAAHPDAIGAGA
jgi:maleylacetoacetate isomerase